LLGACASKTGAGGDDSTNAITSNVADILDFRFSAEVIASKGTPARAAIVSQLQYLQGAFTTAERGNGHIGEVDLSEIAETPNGATKTVRYTASLPVAWPKGHDKPDAYDLVMPRDTTALDAFNAKYDGKCGKNEYGQETFWHDWNPKADGCEIDQADVVRGRATVKAHPKETRDKYPEYDLIWQDGKLEVVAVFGIIESDTPTDFGHREHDKFVNGALDLVSAGEKKEAARTSSILRDTTVTGKLRVDGVDRDVRVTTLLVQELASVGPDFDARYDALTEDADLVLYNGHAGLGKNANAFGRKGKIAKQHYQLMLLNGCQTFAYLDTTPMDRRIALNGAFDDPLGTKYLDLVGNALPGFASNLANMSLTLLRAAAHPEQPRSFNELLDDMPEEHIVVVFGEEDNAFSPAK
jgi:hypothetical protein